MGPVLRLADTATVFSIFFSPVCNRAAPGVCEY
jgi:hypothetical protein